MYLQSATNEMLVKFCECEPCAGPAAVLALNASTVLDENVWDGPVLSFIFIATVIRHEQGHP